jgi:hypothetical protein
MIPFLSCDIDTFTASKFMAASLILSILVLLLLTTTVLAVFSTYSPTFTARLI